MTRFLPSMLLAAATVARTQTNRCNVLFIAVDDLRLELGCYGADDAQTPNMGKCASTDRQVGKLLATT